jgi:hypothetical protein
MPAHKPLSLLGPFAAHQCVDVLKEVGVVIKLSSQSLPFPLEDRACQGVLDFTLPKQPKFFGNVSALVKLINLGYQLEAV